MMRSLKNLIEINPPISLLKYFTCIVPKKNHLWNDVILTSRGRDGIELMISFLKLTKNDVVLLPALTCDTVTAPFERTCKVDFYDLEYDYSANIENILFHIMNYRDIKILYVINYFGIIQKELKRIHEICKQNNILLAEDHSHSALSSLIGPKLCAADFKIYSFRKLFPTPDGGGIWINDKHNLPTKFKYSRVDNLKSVIQGSIIGIKRKVYHFPYFRKIIEYCIRHEKENDYFVKRHSSVLPISSNSKNIINSSNIDSISKERRKQFLLWVSLFDGTGFNSAFCYLEETTIPHCFPLKVANPLEILEYFKKYNIYLKIHWPHLNPSTLISCPVSHYLAKYSLSLPIYPGLRYSEMKFIRDNILKIGVSSLPVV